MLQARRYTEDVGDGGAQGGALAEDDGAGHQVAEALVAAREQDAQGGDGTAGDAELDQGQGGADGGVAEADRRPLDGDHPQAHRRLAHRPAPPQRLQGDGVAEDQPAVEQDEAGDHPSDARVGALEGGEGPDREQAAGGREDEPVEDEGEQPRADVGGREVERHRLRGDHRKPPGRPGRRRVGHPPTVDAAMDVDRFLRANAPVWARFDDLTTRAGRGVGRLPAADLDELVGLYQRVSTHLSYARTVFREPALTADLTRRVARGAAVVYGTRPRTWAALGRFFSLTFPAAVWHTRRTLAVAAALFAVPAVVAGLWIGASGRAREATGSEAARRAYVERDFAGYYRSEPAAAFASEVFVNNVGVAVLAFGVGVALCLPTAVVLALNGADLGMAAGLFAAAGHQPRFWGLLLPHGLLEITAVCVAGAAGMRLGWALVDPGDRPRSAALADEGRRAVMIVAGLVPVFALAGTIEGFVTGSGLATAARVGVGVAVEAAFLTWVVVRGRAAASLGLSGALGEERRTRGTDGTGLVRWRRRPVPTGAPPP